MTEFAGPIINPAGPNMMYPAWDHNIQILLMIVTGIVFLLIPVRSTALTSGIIALYLVLLGAVSATSVISDRSDMGWKLLICIFGILVFCVSLYYFFKNMFSFTEMYFQLFLTGMFLLVGLIQMVRGFSRDDPVIRLIGVSTGIVGIIIILCLSLSVWWAPVVIGVLLLIAGIVSYLLKNALVANRERSHL